MLDPKLVRENPDAIKEATRVKPRWLAGVGRCMAGCGREALRAAQTSADRLKNDQKTAGEKMKAKLSPEERTQLQATLRAR